MPLDERLEQYLPSQSDWREFVMQEFPRFASLGDVPVEKIQDVADGRLSPPNVTAKLTLDRMKDEAFRQQAEPAWAEFVENVRWAWGIAKLPPEALGMSLGGLLYEGDLVKVIAAWELFVLDVRCAWADFLTSEEAIACLHSDWEDFLSDELPEDMASLPLEEILSTEQSRDQVLKIWERFLLATSPKEYLDKPETEYATNALPGPGKIGVLAERWRRRESLWHPGDATYEQADRGGRPIQVVRNGRNKGIKLVELGTDEALPASPQKAA